jgi:hypothetical protein
VHGLIIPSIASKLIKNTTVVSVPGKGSEDGPAADEFDKVKLGISTCCNLSLMPAPVLYNMNENV